MIKLYYSQNFVWESSHFQEFKKKNPIPSKVIDSQAFHKNRGSAQLIFCSKEGHSAITIFYSEYKIPEWHHTLGRTLSTFVCVAVHPSSALQTKPRPWESPRWLHIYLPLVPGWQEMSSVPSQAVEPRYNPALPTLINKSLCAHARLAQSPSAPLRTRLCCSALPCRHPRTPAMSPAPAHTWPAKHPFTPLTGHEKYQMCTVFLPGVGIILKSEQHSRAKTDHVMYYSRQPCRMLLSHSPAMNNFVWQAG